MRKFLKNCRAATAIEFAIIAPVFFLLFVGIMEVGLTMFFDSSINTGIRAAARQGVPNGHLSQFEIEKILNSNLGGLYDPNRATLIVLTYNNFDDAALTIDRQQFIANTKTFFDARVGSSLPPLADQSGKIVVYGVRYEWGGITKLLDPFIPKYLYSFSIVRNEAF